jgi:hypothetical protein
MALDLRRDEETLLVTNEHLDLSIHVPTLGMLLRRRNGPERLHGFRPRVLTEDGPLLPREPMVDGHGQIRAKAGVAERIHVQTRLSPLLWLSLQLDIGEDWHGIVIDIELLNRGYTPLRVHALDPLWWSRPAGGELALGHPRGKSLFLEMGHHTDTPPHYWPLGGTRALRTLLRPHSERGPFTPPPTWGVQISDTVATLCAPERTSLTLGFLTAHRFLGFVQLRHRGSEVQELVASTFTEALSLPPRSRIRSERLWVGLDPPGADGIAEWAQRAGAEMEAPTPLPAHPGGVIWTDAPDAPESFESALDDARALGVPGAFVEIAADAAGAGDWGEPRARAAALAPLAARIREAGLAPRIALAPFLLPIESPLASAHAEWLLRDTAGKPVHPGPPVATRDLTVLDPTHPEVLAWLEELGSALAGAGFAQLSLRELEAGALPGTRRDPAQGTAEAYRNALAALRRGLGTDGVLIGQRAPLAPSIGLLTVVRLSPAPAARGDRDPTSALRGLLVRAPLHQRLWLHELGPLALDGPRREDAELEALIGLTATCGTSPVVALAGPASDASAHWLRQLLPPSGRAPVRLAPWDPDSALCTRFPDGSLLVLRLNLTGRDRDLDLELAPLGLAAPLHAWDVLADRPLGVVDDRVRFEEVPPHGCALIRIAPRDGRARLVSSSLHATGGGVEVARIRSEPGGLTRVRLALPGERRGTVRLALPSNEVVTVTVAFRESVELCAAAERVEDSPEISR